MNSYDVEDVRGGKHSIDADALAFDDGMAIFVTADESIIALFWRPLKVIRKSVDTIH